MLFFVLFPFAQNIFGQCVQEGLISLEEMARFWKLIEAECQENAEVIFNLCKMLKETRSWDDEMLCRELRISSENLEDVENRRNPASEEAVGLRVLYELFPRWLCEFPV